MLDSLFTTLVFQHYAEGCTINTVHIILVLGANSLILSCTQQNPACTQTPTNLPGMSPQPSMHAGSREELLCQPIFSQLTSLRCCNNIPECSVTSQPPYTKLSSSDQKHQHSLAVRWMKVVAETLQELHTQEQGRTEPTLLDPFRGISYVSVLMQAACQDHAEVAAAVVAVVKAVASALDFPLPPQQAALCCSKVSTASCAACHSRNRKRQPKVQ